MDASFSPTDPLEGVLSFKRLRNTLMPRRQSGRHPNGFEVLAVGWPVFIHAMVIVELS